MKLKTSNLGSAVASVALILPWISKSRCENDLAIGVKFETDQHLMNWSSTHSCHPFRLYEPENAQEVCRLVNYCHEKSIKIRPVGTSLSPNGIGFNSKNRCLLSVAALDSINIDEKNMLVTVGAGARVSSILAALKKVGLTLHNFSSIQEQQIAGWTQVAAHGTGCTLPTVDDMIIRMKIALPSGGLLTLSQDMNPDLFKFCKVGLGTLGVVTELTLRCAPQMNLKEETFCIPRKEVRKEHAQRLSQYRHVRYMWIPYTDTVVVVQSNPTTEKPSTVPVTAINNQKMTQPLIDLARKLDSSIDNNRLEIMNFAQLRDLLLSFGYLDLPLIRQINEAEALYWKNASGIRIDDSTNILGFECGGEQCVFEVCFPIRREGQDVEFVEKLMLLLEKQGIAAPSPIEQRWTSRSTSVLSPAYSSDEKEIFSWVGIIMYLPTSHGVTSDAQHISSSNKVSREKVMEAFEGYSKLLFPLLQEYSATIHWAKIETPSDPEDMHFLRKLLKEKYPLNDYRRIRRGIDPHYVLTNDMIDSLLLTDS